MKGKFITLEGVEGCGKSTQAKLIQEFLQKRKHEVLLTREPGGPAISEKIRKILLAKENSTMLARTEVLLYSASRSQHTGEWILPALQRGVHVICDRYFDSTLAYQGAARNIDRKVIDSITAFATFDLKPDITFVIDLPVEIGLSRIAANSADRLESESIEFHERVREAFLQIADAEKERFCVIDGTQSIAKIQHEIIKSLQERMDL